MSYKKGDIIASRYEVCRLLGQGGFGVVYLVKDVEQGTHLAFKTLRDGVLGNRNAVDRFLRESEAWVSLDSHENIVQAYFAARIDSHPFIAMEYIAQNERGVNTLEGYLTAGSCQYAQQLKWSIEICSGMSYAATKGLISHRDIKPANIMVTGQGQIKISDFGFAFFSASSSDVVYSGKIAPMEDFSGYHPRNGLWNAGIHAT